MVESSTFETTSNRYEQFQIPGAEFEVIATAKATEGSYPAPLLAPEIYPGDAPPGSGFLMAGDRVYSLAWNSEAADGSTRGGFNPVIMTPDGPLRLNDYLASKNLPTLNERYPIVAFGSNRNPGQLADKFKSTRKKPQPPDMKVIPAFKATLQGADVVYNAKPGNLGYFFADLYAGPETEDTTLEVFVLFLTKEQLQLMHDKERAYQFGEFKPTWVQLGGSLDNGTTGYEMPAFIYAGETELYAKNGQPVALSEIPARNRSLEAQTQTEFQDDFFARDPDGDKRSALIYRSADESTPGSGESYRRLMKMERAGGVSSLDQRKELQADLIASMHDDEKMAINLRTEEIFNSLGKDTAANPTQGEIIPRWFQRHYRQAEAAQDELERLFE